ncbi:hypothetical protein ACI2OX_07055 [Bacillus sp. N9]
MTSTSTGAFFNKKSVHIKENMNPGNAAKNVLNVHHHNTMNR